MNTKLLRIRSDRNVVANDDHVPDSSDRQTCRRNTRVGRRQDVEQSPRQSSKPQRLHVETKQSKFNERSSQKLSRISDKNYRKYVYQTREQDSKEVVVIVEEEEEEEKV